MLALLSISTAPAYFREFVAPYSDREQKMITVSVFTRVFVTGI